MMNTRRTKLSMVRDDSQSSKTSNKKCPVVLHGDHIDTQLQHGNLYLLSPLNHQLNCLYKVHNHCWEIHFRNHYMNNRL